MNTMEREAFWDRLTSTDSSDINDICAQLSKVIKYPDHIYRFRPINSYSLDSLRTNRLYFSSADNYDDPFDSFITVDWDKIMLEMRQTFSNPQFMDQLISNVEKSSGINLESLRLFFNRNNTDWWCEYGRTTIKDIINLVQKNAISICFSEEKLNEVLWLKYAENHRGFVLEYDLSNDAAFLCGTMEKCIPCPASKNRYMLYPVYYSDEKYDATDFVKCTITELAAQMVPLELKEELMKNRPNMMWQREKITLIKHKCHEYDREWRMIYPNNFDMSNMKERPFVCWKPSSVTIGFRTDDATKNLIMALAKEADIPKIYECYINNHNALDRKLLYEKP